MHVLNILFNANLFKIICSPSSVHTLSVIDRLTKKNLFRSKIVQVVKKGIKLEHNTSANWFSFDIIFEIRIAY